MGPLCRFQGGLVNEEPRQHKHLLVDGTGGTLVLRMQFHDYFDQVLLFPGMFSSGLCLSYSWNLPRRCTLRPTQLLREGFVCCRPG